ncbi:hypothetical protein [Streptomyces sp. SJL17-1]|uniref:hypothetical protein n=1 Tax=Streptomyces sp. SJL17-1 TaxID=2967223 RepID=UPI0029662CF6|nr:hypothetical protein [Streptomyces sp. SJL17-1]
MAGEEKYRLGRLCAQLTAIRSLADRQGESAELDALLTELRADGDLSELTSRADELLRRCGVARGLGDHRSYGGVLPHLGGGHPVEEAHVCPKGRCDRVDLEAGGRCELYVVPLRLVRWEA